MSTHTSPTTHYTIKEASRLSGLPGSTLRYYESIGIIHPIGRDTTSGHRSYTQDDINLIDAIACLSATGMSIEDMRAYMNNRLKGREGARDEIDLLQTQKRRIRAELHSLKLRDHYVDLKIAYWRAVEADDTAQMHEIATRAQAIAQDLKFPHN